MSGDEKRVRVGVGGVILSPDGRIFLARRGPEARNERGRWEFPGGSVHYGETLREALAREIREEYGVTVEVGELIDVADHILPEEGQHWVSPAYVCRIVSGEPRILEPEKCTEIRWVFSNELQGYDLTSASRQTLEAFLSKRLI